MQVVRNEPRRWFALVLLCCAVALTALLAGAARPGVASASMMRRGFVDDVWFASANKPLWINRTRATGASIVQIEVDWTSVEPRPPARGQNPRDPAGPQFNFAYLDQRVREFVGTGLQPVFLVTDAPRWAEGRGGTRWEYATGGYRPNARAFGNLAAALARRYSGSYPDPTNSGRRLPRVRYFQAWAEANLKVHLSPQFVRRHRHWVNTGAQIYRGLLNSFYAGIKAGDRGATVITSGFAPYGDPPSRDLRRTQPVLFLRDLLCLNAGLRGSCRTRVHFDVLASDPYEVGSPTSHAYSPLDASTPDIGRLRRVVNAGLRAHHVLPHRRKAVWATEFSYDSRPPNPSHFALSLKTQAHWLEESFYILWRQGVTTALWNKVRDQPPPYTVNYASGVYFRGGKRKLSFRAYRFPLVVMANGGRAQIWGISPINGVVTVQRRVQRRWRVVARFRRRAGAVFSKKIARSLHGPYRAVIRRQYSLVWNYR